MPTLIAVFSSEVCVGRCDARCYDATEEFCGCICGGANHGVGFNQALKNTEAMVKRDQGDFGLTKQLQAFKKLREVGDIELRVAVPNVQMMLFDVDLLGEDTEVVKKS